MIVLGIESSTTSAKVMLADLDRGAPIVRTRPYRLNTLDPAVRDPDEVFRQTAALAREVSADRPVDLVVLSGTWHGLTLQSPSATVTPVMEWPHTGASAVCTPLRQDADFVRWFYGRTGCMVNAIYPAFKLRLLRDQGVDLRGLTAMDQGSVNFERLTGQRWTSVALASGSGLLRSATEDWDAEVLDALGLGDVALPRLVAWDEAAPLSAAGAAALGLRQGIPVLPCAPDGGLCQVGDDANQPGEMTFSMGTSGALRLVTPGPAVSARLSTWCYRSPLTWLSGAATSGCTNCVDWAKSRLFGPAMGYDEIEAGLPAEPPAGPPVFLPFLFGERCPGWQDQRAGGFLDVRGSHTPHDLYFGVLLGVALGLYHCYQELITLNGPPGRIVLSGGVLSSPFWTQLTVDAFGVPMERSTVQHSSLAGAVVLGARFAGRARPPGLTGETVGPMRDGVGSTGKTAGPTVGPMRDSAGPTVGSMRDSAGPTVVQPNPARASYYAEQFARYLDHYQRTAPSDPLAPKETRS